MVEEYTYNTDFDLKAVLTSATDDIKRCDSDWKANSAAMRAFDALYTEEAKPEYTPVHKVTPALIDHSMGYVGVSFRDGEHTGRQYTLVFSKANEVHEVYMDHDDLYKLSQHIYHVTQRGVEAKEKRKAYQAVLNAWKDADTLRREARSKLDDMARSLWKKMKKKNALVTAEEDSIDGIPF